jgi:hypothetical protein
MQMSKKQAETKSTFEKANELARDVFLAQLGLAGKALEQGQEVAEKAQQSYKESTGKVQSLVEKRSEIFADLVKRGEKVQSDAQTKFDELAAKPKALVEEQVEAVKSSVEKLKERINSRKSENATAEA